MLPTTATNALGASDAQPLPGSTLGTNVVGGPSGYINFPASCRLGIYIIQLAYNSSGTAPTPFSPFTFGPGFSLLALYANRTTGIWAAPSNGAVTGPLSYTYVVQRTSQNDTSFQPSFGVNGSCSILISSLPGTLANPMMSVYNKLQIDELQQLRALLSKFPQEKICVTDDSWAEEEVPEPSVLRRTKARMN